MTVPWSGGFVTSIKCEQQDTSDEDEPEDAYTNEPIADEKWLAQYDAERKKGTRTQREATKAFKWSRRSKQNGQFVLVC